MPIEPSRENNGGGLADVIDRLLDKGLVINADIAISLVGVELLGIKIRAAIASFETAAKYGLEFPSGTSMESPARREAFSGREPCPQCDKPVSSFALLQEGCPWCGWISARCEQPLVSKP